MREVRLGGIFRPVQERGRCETAVQFWVERRDLRGQITGGTELYEILPLYFDVGAGAVSSVGALRCLAIDAQTADAGGRGVSSEREAISVEGALDDYSLHNSDADPCFGRCSRRNQRRIGHPAECGMPRAFIRRIRHLHRSDGVPGAGVHERKRCQRVAVNEPYGMAVSDADDDSLLWLRQGV